jgi:hypothetical protein
MCPLVSLANQSSEPIAKTYGLRAFGRDIADWLNSLYLTARCFFLRFEQWEAEENFSDGRPLLRTHSQKTTVCAMTTGNIAELAATAFLELLLSFAVESYDRMHSNRTIGYGGELWRGGEGGTPPRGCEKTR